MSKSGSTSRSTASNTSAGASYGDQAREILVKLVTSLLRDKPKDPVRELQNFIPML